MLEYTQLQLQQTVVHQPAGPRNELRRPPYSWFTRVGDLAPCLGCAMNQRLSFTIPVAWTADQARNANEGDSNCKEVEVIGVQTSYKGWLVQWMETNTITGMRT